MVPADSDRVSRAPPYSGYWIKYIILRLQDYHFLWFNFPVNSTSIIYFWFQSYNPIFAETNMVWALPLSLATTKGITFVFFSSGYLDVSVHRVSFLQRRIFFLRRMGCPIRRFTDQRLFPPPRNLSQVITSFIASESQGIHHTLLFTLFSLPFGFKFFFQYVKEPYTFRY